MLFNNFFSLVFIYIYIYIIRWFISCCDWMVSAVVLCCCGFEQNYSKSSFCFCSLSIFMKMVVGCGFIIMVLHLSV